MNLCGNYLTMLPRRASGGGRIIASDLEHVWSLRRYFRNLGRCAAGLVPVYAVNADLSLAILDTSSWLAPPHFRVLGAGDAPPPQSVMFAVGALGRPKDE